MEKDYRSLEHKIRDLLVSEAMARNSAKRMQVTNVARPDTATDPTDVKSKIAKQGEIKTKIIDEEVEEIEEGKVARHNIDDWHKTAKEKGYTVKKYDDGTHQAWTPDKRSGGPRVVGHHDGSKGWIAKEETEVEEARKGYGKGYKSPWDKIEKAKPGIGARIDAHVKALDDLNKKPTDKKDVKEEVELEEGLSFKKTEGKKWEGVGFGSTPAYHELHADGKPTGITVGGTKGGSYFVKKDGKHVTSSSSMDLAKKAAIDHHKGIKEGADAPEVADKDDKKKKDNSKKTAMNDMDAKELKGGKTEVDTEPKTDDRPETQSVEDAKSKKATKDENKKIGAKGGVKEETMANTPFGLPADLIKTVAEALKGNQHKIDKNHNGKIDADDFKKLRKEEAGVCPKCGSDPCKCNVKEDVEQVDEVSKKTLSNYIRKASSDAANHAYTAGMGDKGEINKDASHDKATSRLKGISKASQKLAKEEVAEEQIDELSKATLGSYAKRSATQLGQKASQSGYAIGIGQGDSEHAKETNRKKMNRFKGLSKAIDKMAKEEVEQVDELSKATVKSYYNKGREQGMEIQNRMKAFGGDWSKDGQDTKTLKKRKAGHEMALRRRRGEVKMSEEAQLSADEMARIEEIAKGLK